MGEKVFKTGIGYYVTEIPEIKASKEDPEIAVIDTPGLTTDTYKEYINPLINEIKSVNKINFIILILKDYRYDDEIIEIIKLLLNLFPNNLSDHFGIVINFFHPEDLSEHPKILEKLIKRINKFSKIEINKQYIFYIPKSEIEIKKDNSIINEINRLKKIVKTKSPLTYKN